MASIKSKFPGMQKQENIVHNEERSQSIETDNKDCKISTQEVNAGYFK